MKRLYLLICVIAFSLAFFGCAQANGPETTQTPTYITKQWTPVYNDHSCGIMAQWADSERASQTELTLEEILSVLPGKQLENAAYTGYADLREDGSVIRVLIWVKKGDAEACVAIGNDAFRFACCISREPDAETSLCGGTEYKIYRKDDILFAETVCNEYPVCISVSTKTKAVDVGETVTMYTYVRENIEQHRPLFEEILEWFSWYDSDEPDLTVITPAGSK